MAVHLNRSFNSFPLFVTERVPMRAPKVIAIATCTDFPQLTRDDQLLLPELAALGISGQPAVWDDPGVDWGSFDAVLIRSTWSYYLTLSRFLAWIDAVDAQTTLWNAATIVRWNCHKSYLADLEAKGVPIIPTVRLESPRQIERVMADKHWNEVVVKPAVSAGANRTYRLTQSGIPGEKPIPRELEGVGELLLQPYYPSVTSEGERSLVFFDGEFSHAFLRSPKLESNPKLTEGSPYTPNVRELEVARRAIEAAPGPTLYCRVDLVPDQSSVPRLMELEMIEPALWLQNCPDGGRRFARGIRSRLGSDRSL